MQRSTQIIIILAVAVCLAGCRSDQPVAPADDASLTPRSEDVRTPGTRDNDPPARRGLFTRRPLKDVVAPMELPDTFVPEIDNPYLNFRRNRVFRYEGETADGFEQIVVEVTPDHKTIQALGVVAAVVRDRAYLNGDLVEDTFDWFAQDEDGNVWYFGEDAKQIQNGMVVGTEGSWEAGVDGALPGIIMLAQPQVGARYPQEVAPSVAEDRARVISLDENVSVLYGDFEGCLETLETTPLDPGAREFKFYAPNVGLLLEAGRKNNLGERIELKVIEH